LAQERYGRRTKRVKSRTAGVLILEEAIQHLYHTTADRVKEKVRPEIPCFCRVLMI
jgi:hypothetical protein